MLPYLVANTKSDAAPPPPPGYVRLEGTCALCRREITWISLDHVSKLKPVVCGYCALELFRKAA
jgi:DNA-directed RNA polymerase subunit RPC12/RpoP